MVKNAIYGLAVGDALGVPAEFQDRAALKLKPITTMIGGGFHGQPAGTWSDDTSMISCTLNGKKYSVDFVAGRALREMEPAAKMYGRIVAISNAAIKGETLPDAKDLSIKDAIDTMIRWFCILFNNQFTPDEVLDYYPADRLMHDIALALMAVQTQTTEVLNEFPTKAAVPEETDSPA